MSLCTALLLAAPPVEFEYAWEPCEPELELPFSCTPSVNDVVFLEGGKVYEYVSEALYPCRVSGSIESDLSVSFAVVDPAGNVSVARGEGETTYYFEGEVRAGYKLRVYNPKKHLATLCIIVEECVAADE